MASFFNTVSFNNATYALEVAELKALREAMAFAALGNLALAAVARCEAKRLASERSALELSRGR